MVAERAARGGRLQQVADTLEQAAQRARPYVPFTALNTVWRSLDGGVRSVLDVGCGRGRPMGFLKSRRPLLAVGIDIFAPYLAECQRKASHDGHVLCDVRYLPFQRKSFDAVLCLEVLEHLEEEEGRKLLLAMEEIARLQVIISTPTGSHPQRGYDGNAYQEHRFLWPPAAMRRLGYRVVGHGLRNLGGMAGVQSSLPKALWPLVHIGWVLAGPFVRLVPEMGADMVCVKRMDRK